MNDKKVVLITGCSSGFGMLTALRLARKKYKVFATMRNLDRSTSLSEEMKKQNLNIHILQLDVTDVSTIQSAINLIKIDFGRLDILINNAGYGIGGFFEDISPEEYRAQIETNFFGVLNVTRQALPLLRKVEDSRIINISSIAGLSSLPGMGAYHASKWALEGFSESLHQELALYGIKVIMVEPGPYPTKVLRENTKFGENTDNPNSLNYKYSLQLLERYNERNQNLKSDPEDVAKLIEKLIVVKRPKFHNIIGPGTKIRRFLHKYTPVRFNHWLIRKFIFRK